MAELRSPVRGVEGENGGLVDAQFDNHATMAAGASDGIRGRCAAETPPTVGRKRRAASAPPAPVVLKKAAVAKIAVCEYLREKRRNPEALKVDFYEKHGVARQTFEYHLSAMEKSGGAQVVRDIGGVLDECVCGGRGGGEDSSKEKNKGGRPKQVAPQDQLYKDTGVTYKVYTEALAYAAGLMKPSGGGSGVSVHKATECALNKYGATLNVNTVKTHVLRHKAADVQPVGRPPVLPREYEEALVAQVEAIRAMGWPVFSDMFREMVYALCEDHPQLCECFPNGVSYRWFRGFMKRHKDKLSVSSPSPLTR